MMSEWDQFYNAVSARVREFKRGWGKAAVPFFRGHGDNRWKLLPAALRANCDCASCGKDGGRYIEQSLYYEYVSGAGMLLENDLSSWDIAFSMQHYGLPTRLLDWTENFSVALFFAVRELAKNDSESGVVWFLDPYWLNGLTCESQEILDVDADFEHDYFTYFWDDLPENEDEAKAKAFPYSVVAIYPRRQNPRISAQKGGFTLHSSRVPLENWYQNLLDNSPLRTKTGEKVVPEHLLVQPFTLTRACLPEAENYLEMAGVNEYSLFPELSGLCEYLKRRFDEHLK